MTTEAQDQVTERTVTRLPREQLMPGPGLNPRTHFDATRLEELAASIREEDIHQPLNAMPRTEDYPLNGADIPDEVTHFVYAGERRWRAAELAGLETVPVIIREIDYETALGIALVENLQREDLSAVEEARGIQRYMNANPKMSQREVGESLGYSQSWVANRLRLLKLPDEILDHIQAGALHTTSARDLLLPWAQLREDLRETWWEKLTTSLNRSITATDDLPLSDGKLEELVRKVGARLSKPTKASYDWQLDDDRPRLTAEQHHEGCDCNAPGWKWSSSMHGSKAVRCFDPERWEELETEAQEAWEKEREAWEKEREARQEEQEEAGFETPEARLEALDLEDRTEVISNQRLQEGLPGRGQYTLVYSGYSESLGSYGDLPDPTQLDPDTIVRVQGRMVAGERRPDNLYCVDPEAVEDANEAGRARRDEEYARRRTERGERDAEEVGWGAPSAAGMATILTGSYSDWDVLQILVDLGHFDMDDVQNQTLHDVLTELEPREIFQVSKILELRIDRGDVTTGYQRRDPLLSEVEEDLEQEYLDELREIAPGGVLPGEEPETEEEQDESKPATDEPDAPSALNAEVWADVYQSLQEKPDVSVEELYSRAKGIDSDISDLSLRQFNARYVLRAKRAAAG